MFNKFFITTPLYYLNASPHIGHSYTNIAADVLARYMREKLGPENVRFLTGTDEHGQKIQRAAEELKLEPKDFADKMVRQFVNLWQSLNISYDDFIRTTEARHIRTVQRALEILKEKADKEEDDKKKVIYEAKYEGWYCTPCETFWTETQLTGQNCPDCNRPVEKISETNYFFRLSMYQDWLINYINNHWDSFIRPESRRMEIISFLKNNKLTDLCISRPRQRLSWGIPLPFSSEHVTYVWFDALINYISAVGEFNKDGVYESDWWPATLHLIGKDILRQHAVYWPIMLHALDIKPPMTIFAHGWWMIDQAKMSKSRGNVVSPIEMVTKYGIDVYRYFLLRDVPFGLDGNFSEEAIIKRFNSDLANDLGNLVYRTLTMVEKYYQGAVPEKGELDEQGKEIEKTINSLSEDVRTCLTYKDDFNNAASEDIRACFIAGNDFNFSSALEKIWALVNMANKYVEQVKPWNLSKENKTRELRQFIRLLVDVIREVAKAIAPFMPQTAESIMQQIGTDTIKKGSPLFPRIDNR